MPRGLGQDGVDPIGYRHGDRAEWPVYIRRSSLQRSGGFGHPTEDRAEPGRRANVWTDGNDRSFENDAELLGVANDARVIIVRSRCSDDRTGRRRTAGYQDRPRARSGKRGGRRTQLLGRCGQNDQEHVQLCGLSHDFVGELTNANVQPLRGQCSAQDLLIRRAGLSTGRYATIDISSGSGVRHPRAFGREMVSERRQHSQDMKRCTERSGYLRSIVQGRVRAIFVSNGEQEIGHRTMYV